MNPPTAIVLDLGARRGALERHWRRVEADCLDALAPASVLAVRGAAEAEAATREVAMAGARKLIAVGGHAAAHGALNAIMGLAEAHRENLKFGVLTLDGADAWARTLGWPRTFMRQLEALRAEHTLPHDVGRAELQDADGRPSTRYFLNGAAFGIAGEIRAAWREHDDHGAVEATGRDTAHTLHALARTLRLLTGRDDAWVRLERRDGNNGNAEIYRGPWVAAMLMVGRYYPGLGEVAPDADPTDGVLDVVGMTGRPDLRALGWLAGILPRGARGTDWPVEQGAAFAATGIGAPIHVELDGVPAGLLPAKFTLLSRQLHTIVPTVPARLMKPRFKPIPAVAHRPLVAGRVTARRAIRA
jgi:diacylglycerol kinase (ATP)